MRSTSPNLMCLTKLNQNVDHNKLISPERNCAFRNEWSMFVSFGQREGNFRISTGSVIKLIAAPLFRKQVWHAEVYVWMLISKWYEVWDLLFNTGIRLIIRNSTLNSLLPGISQMKYYICSSTKKILLAEKSDDHVLHRVASQIL